MSRQIPTLLAGVAACAALCTPAPAGAGEVLSVKGDRVERVNDPFVPGAASSGLGLPPRVTRARSAPRHAATASRRPHGPTSQPAATKRRKKKRVGPTRGQKAVSRALRGALRGRRISRRTFKEYGRLLTRARVTHKRLRGLRRRELGNVIRTLEEIAVQRRLVSSRLRPMFLILKRNTEYWPRRTFPANRDRVIFRGSQLVFEYYRGSGLQLQPLVNFKKANLMHGACVKDTGRPCRPAALRRLLSEMSRTSAWRGGFRAWEYYFTFGGGRPPWVSGMAQATGIQAFARAWQLLGDPRHLVSARAGFGAFTAPPPTGIATMGPFGGRHYLQYSFSRRLFITNAFVQALIGLYDYAVITGDPAARRLFDAAEPEARPEVAASDTGDWSTYSYRGRESTAGYHELLRELLSSLCDRVRTAVYCDTARNFRRYATEPAEVVSLSPAAVVKGQATSVRFFVSKLSAVQVTITRDGRQALDELATFRRGNGSFDWTPRAAGTYSVRVAAKELRTGRGLRTQVLGRIESLPG